MFEQAEKAINDLKQAVLGLRTITDENNEAIVRLDTRLTKLETASSPPVGKHLWVAPNRLMSLSVEGSAWESVLSYANQLTGSADLGNNTSSHDVNTLAAALVGVRLQDDARINKVKAAIDSITKSRLTRALELSRGLPSYLIAADLIGYHPPTVRDWVAKAVMATIQGHSGQGIIGTAKFSSNNWGNHARFAWLVAGIYLQNDTWVKESLESFNEYIGEPVATPRLIFTTTTWHPNSFIKTGVVRKGAYIDGFAMSGAMPEDWRRGSTNFVWPPTKTLYMWEAMQGLVAFQHTATSYGLLDKTSGDSAVLRAAQMLYGLGEPGFNNPVFTYPPSGDDMWIVPLLNYHYKTDLPFTFGTPGKGLGFTYWTHV